MIGWVVATLLQGALILGFLVYKIWCLFNKDDVNTKLNKIESENAILTHKIKTYQKRYKGLLNEKITTDDLNNEPLCNGAIEQK